MPGIDDPAFAFGGDDLVADLRNHIPETRLGIDGDLLARSVPICAAVAGAADARNLGEASPDQPTREVELFAMRSEAHTSELQSLMRISYAVFCLKKKKQL